MECKVLQQFEEVLPFSHLDLYGFKEEQIDDGGHLRMDNISHVCVGHFLSPTHHDGRFFPTTYLGPYGINLILEKISFQYPMKCKDKNLIWEDGSPHGRSTKMEDGRIHPQMIEWMWMESKRLVSHLKIYDTGQQEDKMCWLLFYEPYTSRWDVFSYHLFGSLWDQLGH